MKTQKIYLTVAFCFSVLALGTVRLLAQGAGGAAPQASPLDPVYQKILDAEQRAMSVTNGDEWQVISPLLLKVVQLKLNEHTMDAKLIFGSSFPRGGGIVRGGRNGTPVEVRVLTGMLPAAAEPEADALMGRALNPASKVADLTASETALRTARKKRADAMAKAESDLRAILTHRQEMILESRGLLEMAGDKAPLAPAGALLINFDPALQRIMATNRLFLDVTNDDDWKVISSRLLPVLKLKLNAYMVNVDSIFHKNGINAITQMPAGRPDAGLDLGTRALTGDLAVSMDPAQKQWQHALEIHAPEEDIKAAEAYVKATREQRQAALAQEQADLQDIVTHRQEAALVALGMLE